MSKNRILAPGLATGDALDAKLGIPMRHRANPPGPGMVYLAAVRTSEPGHVPEGATLRSRITAEIITATIRPDAMADVLADPMVVTVQVSRVEHEHDGPRA